MFYLDVSKIDVSSSMRSRKFQPLNLQEIYIKGSRVGSIIELTSHLNKEESIIDIMGF